MAMNGQLNGRPKNVDDKNETFKKQNSNSTLKKQNSNSKINKNQNQLDKSYKNEVEYNKIKKSLPGILNTIGNKKDKNQNQVGQINGNIPEKEEPPSIGTDSKEAAKRKVSLAPETNGEKESKVGSKTSVVSALSSVPRTSACTDDLAIDIQKAKEGLLQGSQPEEKEDNSDKPLASANADQYIKSAIPYLPVKVAVIFLLINMFFPGIGTIVSGFSIFCCGKPRVQTKDGHTGITVCVNVWVGVAQLFTVPFMLVGWFWSFVWGIYMVIFAVEHRKQMQAHQKKEVQANAVTVMDSQIRRWMLKT